mmetsp:Transcript_41958/g.75595  ORF Transcript_41958/g.75595 Transcript_41958/m.75595 type:complete len:99 (-) Transcript_41958:338-634(-)
MGLFLSFQMSWRRKNVMKYEAKYDVDIFNRRRRSIAILDAFVGYGASWINVFNIGSDSAMQTMHSRKAKLTDKQSGRLSRKLTENGLPLWFTIAVTAF